MLADKLDGDLRWPMTAVVSPLLLALFTLILLSFGAKGGNKCKTFVIYAFEFHPYSLSQGGSAYEKTSVSFSYVRYHFYRNMEIYPTMLSNKFGHSLIDVRAKADKIRALKMVKRELILTRRV